MGRRVLRAILAAAAAGATVAVFGLTAAGTAGAATRPAPVVYHPHAAAGAAAGAATIVGTHFAGYDTALFNNWKFRSVAATVPVAACRISPNTNPAGLVQLYGGTSWTADISVFCGGGAGGVYFFDQKSATTHTQGNFRLTPRVGDRIRISISRNVAGHQDAFTATDLRTGRSQTVLVTTSSKVVYQHAFVGAGIAKNSDAMPLPATAELLWTFQNSRVVTYGGVSGTLRGPWATVREIDRSGGVTVMYPSVLSSGGANFNAFLNHN